MDTYEATEQAYKNGYKKGYKAGKRDAKSITRGKWINRRFYALQIICPRFKLWRICKVLGIKPYPWQRKFALGRTESIPAELTYIRVSGKTTAVWLRLLMANPGQPVDILKVLNKDPDFLASDRGRLFWYYEEYRRLAIECMCKDIPVPVDLRIYALYDGQETQED